MPSTFIKHHSPAPRHAEPRRKLISGHKGLTQAYELRDLTSERALSLKDEPLGVSETQASRAQALCALVKAWDTACQQVRILRGKPLPGSLRPERKPKRTKPISSAPSEEPYRLDTTIASVPLSPQHDHMIIEDLGTQDDGAGARVSIVKK